MLYNMIFYASYSKNKCFLYTCFIDEYNRLIISVYIAENKSFTDALKRY